MVQIIENREASTFLKQHLVLASPMYRHMLGNPKHTVDALKAIYGSMLKEQVTVNQQIANLYGVIGPVTWRKYHAIIWHGMEERVGDHTQIQWAEFVEVSVVTPSRVRWLPVIVHRHGNGRNTMQRTFKDINGATIGIRNATTPSFNPLDDKVRQKWDDYLTLARQGNGPIVLLRNGVVDEQSNLRITEPLSVYAHAHACNESSTLVGLQKSPCLLRITDISDDIAPYWDQASTP